MILLSFLTTVIEFLMLLEDFLGMDFIDLSA
jgi:hypothetical protein